MQKKTDDGQEEGRRRANGLLAIGYDVRKLARPLFKKRKGGRHLPDLLIYWSDLFPEIAGKSLPVKLTPAGQLTISVTSAALGVELSHQTPLLIERINTFFGLPAVASVGFKAVQKRNRAEIRESIRKKDPGTYEKLEKSIPKGMPEEARKKLLDILGRL